MKKVVLVTGAGGFIGSHVAETLLARGDLVVALDTINDYYPARYKRRNIRDLARYPGFELIEGDIRDRRLLASLFSGHRFTHVAHLAARAGVRPSINDPFMYQEANVEGTLALLDEARRSSVECFVLTSSSSVYGNTDRAPFREDDTATDRPISPYAATKKASELLAYTYHQLYGLNVTVVRPFTVYGPRGRPDMAPWLFIEAAVRGTPIHQFGDGTSRRDYTYVDDFVQGFVAALDRPLGFEIFNLGNSQTVSLKEAIATVEAVTGRRLNIVMKPMQPGDVMLTSADTTKAQQLLGYRPGTTFREGMTRFYRWYMEHVHLDRDTASVALPDQPAQSA